jgi:hypothetical protein
MRYYFLSLIIIFSFSWGIERILIYIFERKRFLFIVLRGYEGKDDKLNYLTLYLANLALDFGFTSGFNS